MRDATRARSRRGAAPATACGPDSGQHGEGSDLEGAAELLALVDGLGDRTGGDGVADAVGGDCAGVAQAAEQGIVGGAQHRQHDRPDVLDRPVPPGEGLVDVHPGPSGRYPSPFHPE